MLVIKVQTSEEPVVSFAADPGRVVVTVEGAWPAQKGPRESRQDSVRKFWDYRPCGNQPSE